MKRAFLIHGWEGRPDNHWFPWLKLELSARQFEVYAPQMPRADHPVVAEWVERISDIVGEPDPETFLVGHSLGCIAIVRYLETLPAGARLGGCVFVAGFSGDLGIPEIREFCSLPLDMEKARSHARFFNIFSDNDERVSLERSYEFARKLHAKMFLERGKGHFSRDDGSAALPQVMKAITAMAGRKNS